MDIDKTVKYLRDAIPLGEHPDPHSEFISVRLDVVQSAANSIVALRDVLTRFFEGVGQAPVASGVCCCGDSMDRHSSPMDCGHSPVDMWDHFLVGWKDEIDRVLGNKEETDAELAADTNPTGPGKHGELASPVAVGQPLGDGQDPQTGNTETVGDVVLTDTFRGDDSNLINSIASLIELDREGALVPHGIGGHARALLESAAIRLKRKAPALCEDEGCPHHGTPHVCVTPEAPVETMARTIYEQWKDQPGYKPWVEGGNSDKQEEARRLARENLNKQDCCEGGPQWGHAWSCPKLP